MQNFDGLAKGIGKGIAINKVQGFYHLSGCIAYQNYSVVQKNLTENLGLPLIWNRFSLRTRKDVIENFFGIWLSGKGLEEILTAMSVTAAGKNNNDTTLFAGGSSSGHSLDTLVDILIKRIAAVGSDYNI